MGVNFFRVKNDQTGGGGGARGGFGKKPYFFTFFFFEPFPYSNMVLHPSESAFFFTKLCLS